MAKLHHPHAGLLMIRNRKQILIPLTKDLTTLGRKQADIILDDTKVSALHAEIRRKGGRFTLIDRQSTNGTFVNRQQITEVDLEDQDVIEIGLCTLCFFSDLREYHGDAEEATGSTRKNKPAESEGPTELTITKTIAHPTIELDQIEGPEIGKRKKFKKSHITVGRSDADLVVMDLDVSRHHALIEVLGKNSIFIRDLGSTNGTLVNGKRIQTEKIQSGDILHFGNTQWRMTIHPEEEK